MSLSLLEAAYDRGELLRQASDLQASELWEAHAASMAELIPPSMRPFAINQGWIKGGCGNKLWSLHTFLERLCSQTQEGEEQNKKMRLAALCAQQDQWSKQHPVRYLGDSQARERDLEEVWSGFNDRLAPVTSEDWKAYGFSVFEQLDLSCFQVEETWSGLDQTYRSPKDLWANGFSTFQELEDGLRDLEQAWSGLVCILIDKREEEILKVRFYAVEQVLESEKHALLVSIMEEGVPF